MQPTTDPEAEQPNFIVSRARLGRKSPAELLQENLTTVAKAVKLLAAEEAEDAAQDVERLIDLTTFSRLNMMFVSRSAMDSVHFHFRDSTIFISLDPMVQLTKNNAWGIRVTGWFVFWLLAKEVLRLNTIVIDTIGIPVQKMKEELPVESLVNLTLFNVAPMDQKRMAEWDLSGSVLKLDVVDMMCDDGFGCIERAVNMNAEKLRIEFVVNGHIPELILRKPSGLVSDRTKTAHVCYSMSFVRNFPLEHFRILAGFIPACCPKLETLCIETCFIYPFSVANLNAFATRIKTLNEQLMSGPMMSCETRRCKTIIAVTAIFPAQTLRNAIESKHEITTLGEYCNEWPFYPNAKITRQVRLKENLFARYIFIERV